MEEMPGGCLKEELPMAQLSNTIAPVRQTRTPSLGEMPERMPENARGRVPGHAPPMAPQKGKTGGRPRVEAGAPHCLRRPLTNLGRFEGYVQMNQITERLLERSASCPKRTSWIAGGPRERPRSATVNPGTRTPHGATREDARIPRTPLTAGEVAGKRTNSEFMPSILYHHLGSQIHIHQ